MPNPTVEQVHPPLTTFRFDVELRVEPPPPGVTNPVCDAAFSDVTGLDMTMEPKSFNQGGDNFQQVHLPGPVTFGRLTLKRGMTSNLQLWDWFAAAANQPQTFKTTGLVTMKHSDGTAMLIFELTDCLPVKMTAPGLNAKNPTEVAIEEMQLVYRGLKLKTANAASAGGSAANGGAGAGGRSVGGGPGLSGSSAR